MSATSNIEEKYNEVLGRVAECFRTEPSFAFTELACLDDITLDVILFHLEKHPKIKMSGYGVEALEANGKHTIVKYLVEHNLIVPYYRQMMKRKVPQQQI